MWRFSITVAVTIMVIASISTPALADQPEGPVHIALGDSVAAGSGANNGDVTGYVARLNRWLRSVDSEEGGPSASPHLELSDYSVGGATSSDLLADQLPAAVAESAARGTDIKLHTRLWYHWDRCSPPDGVWQLQDWADQVRRRR